MVNLYRLKHPASNTPSSNVHAENNPRSDNAYCFACSQQKSQHRALRIRFRLYFHIRLRSSYVFAVQILMFVYKNHRVSRETHVFFCVLLLDISFCVSFCKQKPVLSALHGMHRDISVVASNLLFCLNSGIAGRAHSDIISSS